MGRDQRGERKIELSEEETVLKLSEASVAEEEVSDKIVMDPAEADRKNQKNKKSRPRGRSILTSSASCASERQGKRKEKEKMEAKKEDAARIHTSHEGSPQPCQAANPRVKTIRGTEKGPRTRELLKNSSAPIQFVEMGLSITRSPPPPSLPSPTHPSEDISCTLQTNITRTRKEDPPPKRTTPPSIHETEKRSPASQFSALVSIATSSLPLNLNRSKKLKSGNEANFTLPETRGSPTSPTHTASPPFCPPPLLSSSSQTNLPCSQSPSNRPSSSLSRFFPHRSPPSPLSQTATLHSPSAKSTEASSSPNHVNHVHARRTPPPPSPLFQITTKLSQPYDSVNIPNSPTASPKSPEGHSVSSPKSQPQQWNDIRSRLDTKKRMADILKTQSPSPSSSPVLYLPMSPPFTSSPPPIDTTSPPPHSPPKERKEATEPPSFAMSPNMEKWDIMEVCIFLNTIGMDQYQQVFFLFFLFFLSSNFTT
jgi:hypothetical protein